MQPKIMNVCNLSRPKSILKNAADQPYIHQPYNYAEISPPALPRCEDDVGDCCKRPRTHHYRPFFLPWDNNSAVPYHHHLRPRWSHCNSCLHRCCGDSPGTWKAAAPTTRGGHGAGGSATARTCELRRTIRSRLRWRCSTGQIFPPTR